MKYNIMLQQSLVFNIDHDTITDDSFTVKFFVRPKIVLDGILRYLSVAPKVSFADQNAVSQLKPKNGKCGIGYYFDIQIKDWKDDRETLAGNSESYEELIALCEDVIHDCEEKVEMLNDMTKILKEHRISVYSGNEDSPIGTVLSHVDWKYPIALKDMDSLFYTKVLQNPATPPGVNPVMYLNPNSFADTLENIANDLTFLAKQTDGDGYYHVDPIEYDSRAAELIGLKRQISQKEGGKTQI